MRMDFAAETYLSWRSKPRGGRISFTRIRKAHLPSALLDTKAFTPRADHHHRQNLFNGQKAIIMEKRKHLVEPGHPIENP
jgi:hypothetical protein